MGVAGVAIPGDTPSPAASCPAPPAPATAFKQSVESTASINGIRTSATEAAKGLWKPGKRYL